MRARRDRTVELDRGHAAGRTGVEGGQLDRVTGDESSTAQVDTRLRTFGERARTETVRAVRREVLAARDRVLDGREAVLRLRTRVDTFLEHRAAQHAPADADAVVVRTRTRVQRHRCRRARNELPVAVAEADLDLAPSRREV